MPHEIAPYGGWSKNLRLYNNQVEVVVTLEVGPRIISYRRLDGRERDTAAGGRNPLKNYPSQLGRSGEAEWQARGGHRLWLAPEDEKLTYAPDNVPVAYEFIDAHTVAVTSAATAPIWFDKRMLLQLEPNGPGLTVRHEITNRGPLPQDLSPWALTVMEAGGLGLVPQPPLGEHPRDLLPNRRMVIWPYTDLTDRRWTFGTRFFSVRQTAGGRPAKIGLTHTENWVGYLIGRTFFAKTVPFSLGSEYPDNGCNLEVFTDGQMVELETLAPRRSLGQDERVEHVERWTIHEFETPVDTTSDDALSARLLPVLQQGGFTSRG